MVFDAQALLSGLQACKKSQRIWLAYSGGMDSHVLLHALSTIKEPLGCELKAVYIDHGLHTDAQHWATHCHLICKQLNIPYQCIEVSIDSIAEEGIEAAARSARYQALGECMAADDLLLTAQHADDQAETLMLQLLRGSGAPGLAAMPARSIFAGGWHIRPLLSYTRSELADYAHRHQLHWIEDPSNKDTRFDRNYLRHTVMPDLLARWPATPHLLSRSASHLAEASELLNELAQQDLNTIDHSQGEVSISGIRALSSSRQRNLLRFWFKQQGIPVPSTTILDQLQHSVLEAEMDSQPLLQWAGVEARRYQDRLYIMKSLIEHDATQVISWDGKRQINLPDGRNLQATDLINQGLDTSKLKDSKLEICFRQGGERCKLAGAGYSKTLKHLLQEWHVPPWQRSRIPLLYINGKLAVIVGLGICEGFQDR